MRNSQELANVIKQTAKSKGITVKKMLSECGLGINTLSSMQAGGYYPRLEAIARIADYLGVSVDYLLGRDEKGPPSEMENGLDKERREWSTAWDQATPELRRAAMAVLKSGEPSPGVQDVPPSGA